jgi:hypothetical protein
MYYNVMSFPKGSYIASCNLYQPPYYYEISTIYNFQWNYLGGWSIISKVMGWWVKHFYEALVKGIGEQSVIFFKRKSNWKSNWVSNMSNAIQWPVDT